MTVDTEVAGELIKVEEQVWDLSPGEVAHLTAVMAQARLGTERAGLLDREAQKAETEARRLLGLAKQIRAEAEAERAAVGAGQAGLMEVLAPARQLDPERVKRVTRRKDGKVVALVAVLPAAPTEPPEPFAGVAVPGTVVACPAPEAGESVPSGIPQAQEVTP